MCQEETSTHIEGRTHTIHSMVNMVYTRCRVHSVRPSNLKTSERIFSKFRIAEIFTKFKIAEID